MWSWLNSSSLESLTKLSTGILYFTVILGILTSLFVYLNIKITQRINYLQNEEKRIMQHRIDSREKKLTPRRLSDQQKEIIVHTLNKFKGTKITIKSIFGDTESIVYGQDFAAALKTAGWQVEFLHALFENIPYGLYLSVNNPHNPPPAASALANLLIIQLNIKVNTLHNLQISPDIMEMVIGCRQ